MSPVLVYFWSVQWRAVWLRSRESVRASSKKCYRDGICISFEALLMLSLYCGGIEIYTS